VPVTRCGCHSSATQLADPDRGLNILIDPVGRARASPFGFAGPSASTTLVSPSMHCLRSTVALVVHGHYDHLDLATLSRLAAKFSPRTITPLANDVTMRSADDAIKTENPSTGMIASNSATALR